MVRERGDVYGAGEGAGRRARPLVGEGEGVVNALAMHGIIAMAIILFPLNLSVLQHKGTL